MLYWHFTVMLLGVRHIVKFDLSKYSHFTGTIENISLLPTQGFCNENYSFIHNHKKYLLRKFIDQTVDRAFEFEVQNLAYVQEIAAKPILLDEENGLMICEFLEGHHKDILHRDDLMDLAKLVKKLHSIKVDASTINLEDQLNETSAELLKAFDTVKDYGTENVLCHNDLNPKNILFDQNVKLIDWEYASINDRYFDLASICVEFDLNKNDERFFLEAYFDADEEIYFEKMYAYKTIYRELCKQWFDNL